jgi:hypothetical protein
MKAKTKINLNLVQQKLEISKSCFKLIKKHKVLLQVTNFLIFLVFSHNKLHSSLIFKQILQYIKFEAFLFLIQSYVHCNIYFPRVNGILELIFNKC